MKKLEVRFHSTNSNLLIGHLASKDRKLYFQFDDAYLDNPLYLSPYKLYPEKGLKEYRESFAPVFGLFNESLPDGWGLLLMDRAFRKAGLDPAGIDAVDRLEYLGSRTMGALTYHPPAQPEEKLHKTLDLSALYKESVKVWQGTATDILPELIKAGGSPGGARPKILAGLKGEELVIHQDSVLESTDGYEPWMIKFMAPTERKDSGIVEYIYSLMAKDAGINMPETKLIESSCANAFFAIKRFDRDSNFKRRHIHSFGNLLHINYRIPSQDYADLLKLGISLTKTHTTNLSLFRRAVFNIASHNRDDHVKNFSFMFDENNQWILAPAYDLTFSQGPGAFRDRAAFQSRRHCAV